MLVPYRPFILGEGASARVVIPGVVCGLAKLPAEHVQSVHAFLLGAVDKFKICDTKQGLLEAANAVKVGWL